MLRIFHKLHARIYAIVAIAMVMALALTYTTLSRSLDNAYDMRKEELHLLVETAISTLQDLENKVQANELTPAEAKEQGSRELEKLRYGTSGYFFAFDHQHINKAHGARPDFNGTDMSGLVDKRGTYMVKELVRIATTQGAGDLTYYFPRPDSDVIEPKLGYVVNFAPWNWVVGTGTYVEDIEAEAAIQRNTALITLGVGLLILGTFGFFMTRSITVPMAALNSRMQGLANGDDSSPIPGTESASEVGAMARTLEVFRNKIQAQQALEAEQKTAETLRNKVVDALRTNLAALSTGDLNSQIDESFPEEYEQLRVDFNKTVDQLQSTISQVVEVSSSIRNGAQEINQSSDELSQRTESQAATLEETAAALEEMTASVKSAADGARDVETTVNEARAKAEDSGEVVQNAVAAMTEIERSSSHISQIISVIDDIAFQTNLLALNAGVEAARAGEAGRGFAVVASEVRGLAQRSSDAAMEIKTLISDSSQQVERGVDLVGKAGDALEQIVQRVSNISSLISGIAEGAAEQSTGLVEINTGMTQLDQVTQQNAAMVQEATTAGHLLNSEAGKLGELVAHFNIGQGNVTPFAMNQPSAPATAPSAHGDADISWEEEVPAAPPPAVAVNAGNPWQDF
ncbi:cache domain-containing protein [Epibacterium ulvae]|uniref:methyl-accepting chemotaxis protein n=1 Tax=Epibacterium ulvae TaxID=1156985 RepID=UPI001BFC7B49|nr:methyl-accepting chemotaxis protein [Epibacterium ulvae]MBT8155181.1 cache domain-containing protein [Epibacterium ulvae]